MVWRYKQQYTDKTLTVRKYMYMRASGASELRKLSRFYIIKLLFLSIFCRYFRYFVQMTFLSAYMYRQVSKCTDKTSEKHYGVGEAVAPLPPPPPPSSGYPSDLSIYTMHLHCLAMTLFSNLQNLQKVENDIAIFNGNVLGHA